MRNMVCSQQNFKYIDIKIVWHKIAERTITFIVVVFYLVIFFYETSSAILDTFEIVLR